MIAPSTDWTLGCELELPDVDRRATLPDGWGWSTTDYSIVGSNGVANDPTGALVRFSGELNSPVCSSVDELCAEVQHIWRLFKPRWNYRSNLHIHIGIPGLTEDVKALQRLAQFTRHHLPSRWDRIDPLEGLLVGQNGTMVAAKARQRHSERSRHFLIPEGRHRLRQAATTVSEALRAEVPHQGKRPLWHLMPREAVNLRSLKKHGTVEFRCFAAPHCPEHVAAAAQFASDWTEQALNEGGPDAVIRSMSGLLPRQDAFDARLEEGWQYTNFHHNSRKVVAERLRNMGLL